MTPLTRQQEQKIQVLVLVALAIAAAGLVWSPARAWGNLLVSGYFLLTLALSGLFFIALQYSCGACWSVAFRRIPEAMTYALPAGALVVALVVIFGTPLYEWRHEAHLAGFKARWLNTPFVLIRAGIFLALWIFVARVIVGRSRGLSPATGLDDHRRNVAWSIAFLPLFAISFWLASVDWIMSLEPHWFSTIFGIYNFAGMFEAGLAAIALLILWLRHSSPLRYAVNEEHLHDLGKLMFAFATFWMYIWFSQYMLIWYADITEETVYYLRRQQGYWWPLFVLNVLLNWVVPFFALLPRRTKRTPDLLAKVAVVMLLGRWLDLYLMVMPAAVPEHPPAGVLEFLLVPAAAAAFVALFARGFAQADAVPAADPLLRASMRYSN